MTLFMSLVLASVGLLGGCLLLFWSYWAVRISVNETRKITRKFRPLSMQTDDRSRTPRPAPRERALSSEGSG